MNTVKKSANRVTRLAVTAASALALISSAALPAGAQRSTKTAAPEPAYSKPGPYAVGVTTLSLPDRKIEVYYPAKTGSTKGKKRATYLQTDAIPADILAGLPAVPPGTDLSVTIPAYRNVPVAASKFPIVLFSHGAGGWRGVYGYPLSGLASWGFVVASVDFTEYGLISQFLGTGGAADPNRRAKISATAVAAIDLVVAENTAKGSRFKGHLLPGKVGAVGHSAGGGTMFSLLDNKRISSIVGWAAVGPQAPVTSHTPTMLITGAEDIAITPASAEASYAALNAPKRFVEIGKLGHNAFSDACLAIRSGTDLIGIAKGLGIGIPDRLLELGRNGCGADSLGTKKGWQIIQQFTVAELRKDLGINKAPIGLTPAAAKAFPGVTITYKQQLK
ncbi:Alpha/beta hydrolase family [Actinobacteria bacterium IMCC26256]|nr:Alpha/beta hydrolase family [Actinobacteria bacterium IMCC26256]